MQLNLQTVHHKLPVMQFEISHTKTEWLSHDVDSNARSRNRTFFSGLFSYCFCQLACHIAVILYFCQSQCQRSVSE
jgi:hypothetical protein